MKGKQRVYIAISVGPIPHFGETEMLRREIERLQSHLGETERPRSLSVIPICLGFVAVAMTIELGGRIERICRAEFDFRFR